MRFELGLFDPVADQPLWQLNLRDDMGTDAARTLNLRAAQSSLVLVQNPPLPASVAARAKAEVGAGALPLTPGLKLLVVGPHGNASMELIQVGAGKRPPPPLLLPLVALSPPRAHLPPCPRITTEGHGKDLPRRHLRAQR